MKNNIFSLFFCVLCFMFYITSVDAINMDSTLYKIESGNINIGAKSSNSSAYKINTTLGQTAAQEFSRNGYVISAGFQYIYAPIPFTFSISKNRIDLGSLVHDQFFNDSADLTVSFGAAGNYQVTAVEEGQLSTVDGSATIDDTGCNRGTSCDEISAGAWDSTSSYGFGYKMSGEDIPSTFTQAGCDNNCYRRFPDILTTPTPESPAVIMNSSGVTLTLNSKPKDIYHSSTITFQVNAKPDQASGSYQTVINFVATPGY